jgi:osmoprotectant transport system ATP-binding protein
MDAEAQPAIAFRSVSYSVPGAPQILRDLSLDVRRGETLVLLGRSGSGKTTSLKLINHLLAPTHGEVMVDGRSTREWDPIRLRRMIGYVIQDIGLLPHFTIARNIGLVPMLENWPAARIRDRVTELMKLVGLDQQLASRYPRELSGGQRQRVGVARALAADPQFLLMDEPFGALDPITRNELQHEFLNLQNRLNKTVVFVTHDVREALLLATRIALMEAGMLVTVGTPEQFLKSQDPLIAAYLAAFSAVIDHPRGTS